MRGARASPAVESMLRAGLDDPACAWSLGSYGALATFARDSDEAVRPVPGGRIGLATARGAIALAPTADLRPFAYETGFASGWSQAVALCLPAEACAMGRRAVVTELGPDAGAARAEDREALLFDLGLGLRAVDACLRTADPAVIAALRSRLGRPLPAPDGSLGLAPDAAAPHRIFVARIGRIEVYGPVPRPGAPMPGGPQAHVLPRLLRGGRTHAATAPVPPGLVPCAALHPPHPGKDAAGRPAPFDRARHAAFGRLLDAWGDPALVAARLAVLAGSAPDPGIAATRHGRSAIRAAQAQCAAARA